MAERTTWTRATWLMGRETARCVLRWWVRALDGYEAPRPGEGLLALLLQSLLARAGRLAGAQLSQNRSM